MAENSEIAVCQRVIAAKSKSFDLASRLLPRSVRNDAVALYAWCRRCDDAIDEVPSEQILEALEVLTAEADAVYKGERLVDPIARAFQEVVRLRRIPREYVDELL